MGDDQPTDDVPATGGARNITTLKTFPSLAELKKHIDRELGKTAGIGNFSQLCEFISHSYEVLSRNAANLDNVLGTFDLQQHSLGVLGILCVKYTLPNVPDFEALYQQTEDFITSCNGEQVRYATDSFADLCHKLTQNLVDRQQPIRGISLLAKAVNKIQLSPSQLTSIHADLCQVCLLSKCMKPALPFLEADITDISKEGGQYDARHFLQYYYYGGMIYTALKKYDRALYFFEIAVTTPSMAVSHIMLESYKKYLLVALILHGKIPNLPKYTSHVVVKYIKPLVQPYNELTTAYATNQPTEIRTMVTKHQEVYNRDNNMGLVKQCVTAIYKKNIQRLTKTFMTLSLTDMANRVLLSGPREAEKYVLHMIEDGEIFATINQRDGMVSFHDSPEKFNTVGIFLKIDQEIQKCIQLDTKLRDMDREISVNPHFVMKSSGVPDDEVSGSNVAGKAAPGAGYAM